MLSKIFTLKEVVQAFDKVTGIWLRAEIKEFKDQNSVAVSWIGYEKWGCSTLVVDFDTPMENWPVRKELKVTDNYDRKSRVRIINNKATDKAVGYNRSLVMEGDTVYFTRGLGEKLECGVVQSNDPFKKQLKVIVDTKVLDIPYTDIRGHDFVKNKPVVTTESDNDNDSESDNDDEINLGQKSSCVEKPSAPKRLPPLTCGPLHFKIPVNEDIELDYAPCSNGILTLNATVNFHNSGTYIVKRLFFDEPKNKAMANLTNEEHDISITMAAVQCTMDIPDFLLKETPSNPAAIKNSPRLAFYVFAAIKRFLASLKQKSKQKETLMVSNPFVKQLLGISNGQSVTYSLLPGTNVDRQNAVWDKILGSNWDRIPRDENTGMTTIIRSMTFCENCRFFSTISVSVSMSHGQYSGVDNYREIVCDNAAVNIANH